MTRKNQESRRAFLKESAIAASGTLLWGGRVHVGEASEVGKVYDGWREGEFEIHSIYTGCGESVFHIFPDGTSLLLDAGDWIPPREYGVDLLPNTDRRSGEWIARYIGRVNPKGNNVDYMLLSHFHEDHGGCPQCAAGKTEGRGDDYSLSGLAQVGEYINFGKGFDRGYPDYDRFVNPEDPTTENFRRFTRWASKEKGLVMEKFEPGRLDQLALLKKPSEFDFHIRNLTANGTYWTGKEEAGRPETKDFFAPDARPSENGVSLAMRMSYGPFRYWTGGDLDHSELETIAGEVAGPVDVAKANHHACSNAMSSGFVRAVAAQVWTVNVWDHFHTSNEALETMTSEELYPGPRLVCPTIFPANRREAVADKSYKSCIAQDGGHIVIKVAPGGGSFTVYYLTAHDESMKIKAVYGPFESTGTRRAEVYFAERQTCLI